MGNFELIRKFEFKKIGGFPYSKVEILRVSRGSKYVAIYQVGLGQSTAGTWEYSGLGDTPREAVKALRLDYKLQTDSKFRATWARLNGGEPTTRIMPGGMIYHTTAGKRR